MVIQKIDVGANHLGSSKHRDANMTTRILVRDIMNSPLISSSPDSNIKEIAEKMKTERIGSIVIFKVNLTYKWRQGNKSDSCKQKDYSTNYCKYAYYCNAYWTFRFQI